MVEVDRDEVFAVVRKIHCGRKPYKDSDRIYHDLGIAGDDVDELFEAIHHRFGTSFAGFRFDRYFPDDVDAFVYHFTRWFGFDAKVEPVTLGHLVNVIRAGHWYDP